MPVDWTQNWFISKDTAWCQDIDKNIIKSIRIVKISILKRLSFLNKPFQEILKILVKANGHLKKWLLEFIKTMALFVLNLDKLS